MEVLNNFNNLLKKRSLLIRNLDAVKVFNLPPLQFEYRNNSYIQNCADRATKNNEEFNDLNKDFNSIRCFLHNDQTSYELLWEEHYLRDFVDLFLSLPAKFVCDTFFTKSEYEYEPISDLFYSMTGYDGAPLNHIHPKDSRLMKWRSYFNVNRLNLVGKFEIQNNYGEIVKGVYKAGEMHGPVETYKEGVLINVTDNKFGLAHGKSIDYWQNGNVRKKTLYQNGRRIGIEKRFNNKGILISETQYKDGNWIKHRYFDESGKCIKERESNNYEK